MFRMDLKIASLAMSYLITEEKVRRCASDVAEYEEDFMVPCDNGIRVSGAFYKMRPYEDLRDYVEDINSYVRDARNEGAQILVFPQLMGMLPVTFMPSYKKLEKEVLNFFTSSSPDNASFRAFVEAAQGFLGEIFFNTFSTMARYHKVIISAGGFYHITDGRIYNTTYCFDENGRVAGRQDKLFLSKNERLLGVSEGDEINICRTSLGKLALLSSCRDERYEPFFISSLMGASLVLLSSGPFDSENSGLVHRANENRQCIVSSGIDSSYLGNGSVLKEKALIAVPYALSLKKDGILRQGDKSVNTAMINVDKLKNAFDNYSADLNVEFLKEMLK